MRARLLRGVREALALLAWRTDAPVPAIDRVVPLAGLPALAEAAAGGPCRAPHVGG